MPLFYTDGSLHLDYLYNNGNPSNDAFKPYDHILSLGDRFKLMTGAEYSVMKDTALGHDSFNGWTCFAGVRVYF